MMRLSDFPEVLEDSKVPQPDPCDCLHCLDETGETREVLWERLLTEKEKEKEKDFFSSLEFEADDDETIACKLLEQFQELSIPLICPEVRAVVPIPVWTALCHLEQKVTHFLDGLAEVESEGGK